MPEFVISLEATDDFLKNRIINLPESVVASTHNTEKGLLRRLSEYRALNTDDDTVLSYFDEHEFLPEKIGMLSNIFFHEIMVIYSYFLFFFSLLFLNKFFFSHKPLSL